MVNLYVALIHYPVINRLGDTIASAVTNLDLHDIARSARTYGVKAFYVVTPLADQVGLVKTIVSHWTEGPGSQYNPKRKEALALIRIADSLNGVIEDLNAQRIERPTIVATSARKRLGSISYEELGVKVKTGAPFLLLLGTAWGLSETIMETTDYWLSPLSGPGDYNHLSVRSAAAIILDRLLGR